MYTSLCRLFTTTGNTPISGYSKAKAAIDKLLPDFPEWRLHDLRRTAASGMARLDGQPAVIERVLNHVSGAQGGLQGVYQRYDYYAERQVVIRRGKLALAQIWCKSDRTDQASLEEINLRPAVPLAFDELELGDLTFRLSIRPRQSDRGADRSFILGDAAGERGRQARPGSRYPCREFSIDLVADMAWNEAMIARASTRGGTPFSIAAMVTVSAFERA
jgi:hypothetical protein